MQADTSSSLHLRSSSSDLGQDQSASSSFLDRISSSNGPIKPTALTCTPRMITGTQNGAFKPNPKYALVSQTMIIKEPTSVKEALQHSGWVQAMSDDLAAFEKNNTWTLVPRQADMNII